MPFRKAFVSFVMLFVFLAAVPRQAHAQGTYTQIDVPGSLFTQCFGVNTKGDLVGLYEDASGVDHGFLLSGGVYTDIDDPGWSLTVPSGINDEGQIVGYVSDYPALSGFLYDAQTRTFTELNYPGATATVPNGINNAGIIVGYYDVGEPVMNGFELSSSGYTDISPSGRALTQAFGITSSDAVVGVAVNPGAENFGTFNNFAFYDGKFELLNLPSGYSLTAVNPQGTILVGIFLTIPVDLGWVYRNGKSQTLSFPGAKETLPYGINRHEEIVGWFEDASGNGHGFTLAPSH
jgi:uncharacterized membrane protein